MAKNKKSKILAMALCASVMAGIYASPVMAKEFRLDGNSSVTTENTTSTGGYTQNEVRVNISDGISSDTIGTFYSNEEEAGFKTDYTMTASTFTLEAGGRIWASLTVDGLTYTNQNTSNTVSLTADGLTFSNLKNLGDAAVLNAAAINSWNEKTQNINAKETEAGKTHFDGKVIADKFGTDNDGFHVDENGTLKSNKITVHKGEFTVDRNGAVKAANGAFTVDKDGNVTSKLINGVDVSAIGTNTAGITHENVTKNITKTNIENSSITSAGELYINKANGQTNFSVDKYGNANVRNTLIANEISINNDRFTVNKYGTVKSESDFITTDKAGNKKYSLNAVGADLEKLTGNVGNIGGNVAGISRNNGDLPYGQGVTSIEGVVDVDGNNNLVHFRNAEGNTSVLINAGTGQIIADSIGANDVTTANLSAGNGAFGVSEDGAVRVQSSDLLINNGSKDESIAMTDGGLSLITTGDNGTGMVTLSNGTVSLMGGSTSTVTINGDGTTFGTLLGNETTNINGGTVTASEDVVADGVSLKNLAGKFDATNANVAGIHRDAAEGAAYGEGVTSIEGSTSFDANGMVVGDNAIVANTDGSFSAGNGSFKVSDGVTTIGGDTLAVTDEGYVTINNGAFSVGPDGMVAVGNSIQLDGETGVVSANDLRANNNVYSKNYNLEEVGADLKELSGDFTTTNANVAGIERIGEGAPGEGITTIEGDALFVSKNVTYMSSGDAMIQASTDSAYMSFGDNMISINKGGINLTGSVGFTGHDGGRYTLSDLEGRVYDLEQKTQNITSTDPGQGGGSEVPPTDEGHTGFEGDVTVGGDINADEGNFNKVNTDEINVGDNTFIDGDSVNSNEGNFKDKVTVGSGENQTVINNGGITVGDSEGTSINHDEVRVGGEGGSYMNENDVVTGEGNSLNDTANRVGNLEQGVSELNNRVGELEDRIDKVGAMAAAIANLRTMGYDPAAPTEVAVGIGQYRDETGAALGLFHYPNRDFMLSLSVSTSGDEVMGGIGATWKFGRKSPEKVAEIKKAQAEADARRAEEAKLAKAEEMKQAAKEAKIKAQQERHAKLAAERAAQAEAAK